MSEPKVKQWMRDAASELGNLDIDDFQREALTECDRDEDRANALMLERLAGVIAKHAPKSEPQPIRRGDVVQWQNDISNRISTGTVLRCRDGRAMIHLGHTHTSQLTADLARIGRARYYPDGTPVED